MSADQNMATLHRSSALLVGTYAAFSLVGLVAVAYCLARLLTSSAQVDDLPLGRALFGNWTSTLVIVDLLIAASATIVWSVSEARRLGMKWGFWLLLMSTTPFAFTLPLFLAMRERRRGELMELDARR
jgi:hypothetical protein